MVRSKTTVPFFVVAEQLEVARVGGSSAYAAMRAQARKKPGHCRIAR